jgi:hypothetical protein
VNGFRAYTEGDDLRRIDWKLTAKRGTAWIREYAGLTGGSVLVVVDCAGTPEDAPALAHLTAAAGGAIDAAIRGGRSCTLLVIAGAAILSVTPVARSADYLPAITALAPLSPPDPLYRALPPAPAPLASPFGTRLARVASAFHAAAHDPLFATQLVRMFLDHDYPAVHACSLCSGDLSHLQILADAAARFRASFTLVVPPARAAPELLQRIRGVEVVRA